MYTVKILSEADFDKLPYKHAKRSLGLADAKTGVAFVRDTGYNDITKHTIDHELDELMAKVSPHEEDGIRYKSLASYGAGAGGGALSNILGSVLPGKIGSLVKGASPLIAAGAGAAANRKGNPWQGALQGFAGGGAGDALYGGGKNVIQGMSTPGGTFGKALANFGTGAKQGALNYAGEIPGFKGIGTSAPTGAIARWMQGTGNVATGAAGAPTASGTGSAGAAAPNAPQVAKNAQASGINSIMDQFKGALPGFGVAALGSLFAPKVETPDIAGVGDDLRAGLQSGVYGDRLAKDLGMKELTRVLTEDMNTAPANAFALGDIENTQAKKEALDQYVNHFKSIRPGADFRNDPKFFSGYTELENQYDRVRSAQRDATQFEYNQQQLQQKYNYMVQAIGLDQYQMQQYIELAQLDVDQLMLEYGLSVGDATQFKQLFSDLGQSMIEAQRPANTIDVAQLLGAGKGGEA